MSKQTGKKGGPAGLINPTVRNYMETLNLQRFYGGYVLTPLPEGVYNLGIGEVGNIDLEEDLFEVYRDYIQQESRADLALRYSGTMGEKETNRLEAEWLNALLGEERFHDELVVSLDGGHNAVSAAIRAFTSPLGSRLSRKQYLLLASPSYPYFSSVVACHAGIQAFLAYDGEQFTRGVETYCNDSVGLILVNVPNNPMGYALEKEQVGRINRVAERYDCAILVDFVYGSYAADPKAGQALAGFDPERTVFADSFSKRYGFPGLRLGFAASAAPSLTHAIRFVKMSESLTPSNLKLAFAGYLMEKYSDVPRKIALEIRERNSRFREAFSPPPHSGVKLMGGRANPFYLTLDIAQVIAKCGLPESEIVAYCQDSSNVRVIPGSFIYPSDLLDFTHFTSSGRLNPGENPPYLPPSFPAEARIVFAPDFFSGRIPLLRLSFGVENRIESAARALGNALGHLAEGGHSGPEGGG